MHLCGSIYYPPTLIPVGELKLCFSQAAPATGELNEWTHTPH